MCNNITCAGQYTVDLINNNISRDVQEMCIAAMMENTGYLTPCPNYTRQNQSYITANQKSVWADAHCSRNEIIMFII